MKSIFIIAVLTAFISVSGLNAQTNDQVTTSTKTDTITVKGACSMCKSRIESVAKIQGVNKAVWNADQQKLMLVYNPAVTSSEAVQRKIAEAGHDTEKFRADDKVYAKLPGCCHYERIAQ